MDKIYKIEKIFPHNTRQIITEVFVSNLDKSKCTKVNALWDTGTSHSSLSDKLIEFLDLQPTKTAKAINTTGKRDCEVYIGLLGFKELGHLFKLQLIKHKFIEEQNHDVLVGMDIISMGEFTLTRIDNEIRFEFRITEFSNTVPTHPA